MKTFCLGDIHGAYKALLQCFERSGFDYMKDRLIALGDVCDGYPQVKECFDELLKIKNLHYVIGNHDLWALDWAQKEIKENIWLEQGGFNTIASYGFDEMPQEHIDFLKNAHPWVVCDGKLFVHGGLNPFEPIEDQRLEMLVWDRDFFYDAKEKSVVNPDFHYDGYEEIFIGHTPTQTFGTTEPFKMCNVWALDTGAGWSGKLTIMNIETKEYWQSDLTPSLYAKLKTSQTIH